MQIYADASLILISQLVLVKDIVESGRNVMEIFFLSINWNTTNVSNTNISFPHSYGWQCHGFYNLIASHMHM